MVIQVWDYTVEDVLKELIGITYTNKMHILLDRSSLNNSLVKHVCHGIIIGWVAFWEISRACE